MILARRCFHFRRIPLWRCTASTSYSEVLHIHPNVTTGDQKYGYSQHDSLKPTFDMNNPARTSTVVLENYYVQVANFHKDPSYKIAKFFSKTADGLWACDVYVKWPIPNQFHAEESKKTDAAKVASYRAIEWLQSLGKIDSDGRPLLVIDRNPQINLNISDELIQSIDALSSKYKQEIKPFYEAYENEHGSEARRYFDNFDHEFPSYSNLRNEIIEERDEILSCKLREIPARCPLPIDVLSDEIVEMIENNRVIVIKGATGSGKTTRVPQLLLDHYIKNNMGSKCNVVVAQPRRITAVSLATRIASERAEQIGFSVGFHVRFSLCYPPFPGSIVFVTSGMLLLRMLFDPMLSDVSHIIIDEAHERDLNIDLLLMLTKELLQKNDKIRIIIMSATINAEFFQQYFNNCPLLPIPGFMYNVQTHYLDDEDISAAIGQNSYGNNDERDINENLFVNILRWIHRNRPLGAILVFLPGWSDISNLQNLLQENSDMWVLIAHSKMNIEQQELIFEKPPEGKRKVILATNIAESSITIPDVVYVVDSGLVKSVGTFRGIKGLANAWISKATADQRLGRAGRVSEGECFRLYSRAKYESFNQYPIPEIMRVSLVNLLMRIKLYSDDKLTNSLSKFPSMPPHDMVVNAVRYLQQLNVFDQNENLTPLGHRIANFTLHPLLSVALVHSVFFKCVDPMLFITSNLNGDASIFSVTSKSSDRRSLLIGQHSMNDYLAANRIYNMWAKNAEKSTSDEDLLELNMKALYTFKRTLRLNLDYLFKAHLVTMDDIERNEMGSFDKDEETLVTSVLFSATGRLAANVRPYSITGKANHFLNTLDGLKVQIGNDSVNFKNSQSSPFLTYYSINTTEEGFLRIFDTAQISPLTVLLFSPMLPSILSSETLEELRLAYPNIDLSISINKNNLAPLLQLREMMRDCLKFFITHYDSYSEEPKIIATFRQELISILKMVVRESDNELKYIHLM